MRSSDSEHGPLPVCLALLALVSGVVDAVSFLRLGHVFVANMTGNVVFVGLAVAGARDVSVGDTLAALVAFGAGSAVGARVGARFRAHRGRLLAIGCACQLPLIAAAIVDVALFPRAGGGLRYATVALLSSSIGIQNAVARRIAVPEMTTTVLTSTITALVMASSRAGGKAGRSGYGVLSIVSLIAGALLGGVVLLRRGIPEALACAFAVVAIAAAIASVSSRGPARTWSSER